VCAGCVCVCGGVRPRYGAFRDYSGSLVCVESGQRERPEILHDSPVLLGAFKKKTMTVDRELALLIKLQEYKFEKIAENRFE